MTRHLPGRLTYALQVRFPHRFPFLPLFLLAVFSAAFSMLAAAPVFSQEGPTVDAGAASEKAGSTDSAVPRAAAPRKLLLSIGIDTATGLSDLDAHFISDSINQALTGLGDWIIVIRDDDEDALGTDEARNERARMNDADGWIQVTVSLANGALGAQARALDLTAANQAMTETELVRDRKYVIQDLQFESWSEIVSLVSRRFPAVDPGILRQGERRLTLIGIPGTLVSGLPGGTALIGNDGKTTVTAPAFSTHHLRATRMGWLPAELTVFLDKDREEDLAQKPSPLWSLDVFLNNWGFWGTSLWWRPGSGDAFARASIATNLPGFSWMPSLHLGSSIFSTISVETGISILPVDSPVRFSISVGAFGRFDHFTEFGLGGTLLDPVSPGGFSWGLGIEISPLLKLHLFLEWSFLQYWTPYPDLFLAILQGWGGSGYTFYGNLVNSPSNFRFGFRIVM